MKKAAEVGVEATTERRRLTMSSEKVFGQMRRALEGLRLGELAGASGFRERKRGSLTPRAFFWTVTLGSMSQGPRTQADLARLASRLSGVPISRQALNQRLGEESAEFMRLAFQRLLRQANKLPSPALPGKLTGFDDIELVDSSSIRLTDKLARTFPACRTNVRSSAAKLHTLMSLSGRHPTRVEITSERVADRRIPHVGPWVGGTLFLADLGYYDYKLFADIVNRGGDIVSRVKATANGIIKATRRGCAKRFVDGKLNDAEFYGRQVDVDVAFRIPGGTLTLRVVALFNKRSCDYHWYLTSLDPEHWSPDEVARLYGLRWQIELLFKELKGSFSLGDHNTVHEHVVRTLVYASLCALLIARMICWYASQQHGLDWHTMSPTIAAGIIPECRLPLGAALVKSNYSDLRSTLDVLAKTLAIQAVVPNGTSAVLAFEEGAA
jgi:IS4 transposase